MSSLDYTFRRPSRASGGVTIRTAAPQQIMGALYYELEVARETLSGAAMTSWLNGAYKRTEKDFGLWLDQRAQANPAELQHVYEWNSVGLAQQRLFKLNRTNPTNNSFKISYQFLPSRRVAPINPRLLEPGPSGKVVKRSSVFRQKAKIMESGLPVIIRPKGNNWLAVPVSQGRFRGRQNRRGVDENGVGLAFSRGPIIVQEPGGRQATGGFGRNFRLYFTSGIATKRLRYSGYMDEVSMVAKAAGEKIPAQIRSARFTGGISDAAVKRFAKLAVDQAARIYDD